jgi:diguanylate cyclase
VRPLNWAAAAGAAAVVVAAAFGVGRASTGPALAAARRAALTDALTGVANRAGLSAELERRRIGGQPFAVLLVDLDGFKQVNDTFGHTVGDQVLATIAGRLAQVVAGAGVAARLGGDEFVLVAASAAPVVSTLLGHEVTRQAARPVDTDAGPVRVRASVGVVHAWPGDELRAVLHSADVAMYQAKTTGAGMCEYHPAHALVDVATERPAVRLRDLTSAGRALLAEEVTG